MNVERIGRFLDEMSDEETWNGRNQDETLYLDDPKKIEIYDDDDDDNDNKESFLQFFFSLFFFQGRDKKKMLKKQKGETPT